MKSNIRTFSLIAYVFILAACETPNATKGDKLVDNRSQENQANYQKPNRKKQAIDWEQVKKQADIHKEILSRPVDMSPFNIDEFEKKTQAGRAEYTFKLPTGTEFFRSKDDYYLEIEEPSYPALLKIQKKYRLSGSLQEYSVVFHNSFVFFNKKFDEQGKLIKEVNYNSPFKFTFEDVLDFIRQEQDEIDLFDRHTKIYRAVGDDGPVWQVRYQRIYSGVEAVILDGITGKVIKRKHYKFGN